MRRLDCVSLAFWMMLIRKVLDIGDFERRGIAGGRFSEGGIQVSTAACDCHHLRRYHLGKFKLFEETHKSQNRFNAWMRGFDIKRCYMAKHC